MTIYFLQSITENKLKTLKELDFCISLPMSGGVAVNGTLRPR